MYCFVLLFNMFNEITLFNENSVDPDQMPHLVLHCLLMYRFYGTLGIN